MLSKHISVDLISLYPKMSLHSNEQMHLMVPQSHLKYNGDLFCSSSKALENLPLSVKLFPTLIVFKSVLYSLAFKLFVSCCMV